ncbi:MAG: phosphoribosylformylglycinamidine synthase [Clostridiales Family XIII bacterium]|jgi:phosphoribosylformylglycinamidine synthase|nr:phosphoribosylformylglycinamidine synthase [Clostridiales Family XIII bacterium]
MIKRIFVEKRRGFDVEARNLMKELRENLSLRGIRSVRIFNRYDVEDVTDDTFEQAATTIFSEPSLDLTYGADMVFPEDSFNFGVEYLPGQYDQRADAAEQCIRLIDVGSDPTVRYAKFISVDGDLSVPEKEAIEKYCINPVDSREASFDQPSTLGMYAPDPPSVPVVAGFRHMDEKALRGIKEEMGLAMRYADLKLIRDRFRSVERRDPTITEIRVLDTYWSDHCRHSTFLTELKNIDFDKGAYAELVEAAFDDYMKMRKKLYGDGAGEPICLMDIATIGAKYLKRKGLLKDLDESDEINACSIKVNARVWDHSGSKGKKNERDEDWLVMFKNETHNHPTEIEPFGGAATCLGGAIRDPLSGRAYVYQAMRVTGSGDPRVPLRDTLPGKLPQYQITRGAFKGYSSYGNQVGLATGFIDEIYDEGYVAKRMEIGAVIGAAPAAHVRRAKPAPGDVVLVVGGRTGRDGIGGATGSSKEHTNESLTTAGAEVQKGNPLVERDIQRLFRRGEATRLIKKCNDFGAGGVAVAIGELADSIDVNLDKVPKKYEGLDGTELAISESQERMAVVVAASDVDEFVAYALEENVEATPTAKVTDSGRFRMLWRGDVILDLPRDFIDTNGARAERDVRVKNNALPASSPFRIAVAASSSAGGATPEGFSDISVDREILLSVVDDLAVCGKRGLVEGFDSTIGRGSVLMPLGGRTQRTPALGMAAKLPVASGDTSTATLMAYGFDPKLAKEAPYHGAVAAVVDSVAKIVAMGGQMDGVRLTFQEYYEKLGKVPFRWGKPFSALLGALKAQTELGIPSVGGKDSMSGTFNHLDVPPTLVSFAVAVTDIKRVLSPEFKKEGSKLVLVPAAVGADGLVDMRQFKANMLRVGELTAKGKILSAQTVGQGGVWAAAAKMSLGNRVSASLHGLSADELFAPSYGSLLLEVDASLKFGALFAAAGASGTAGGDAGAGYRYVGETTGDERVVVALPGIDDKVVLTIDEIERRWDSALDRVFPNEAPRREYEAPDDYIRALSYAARGRTSAAAVGIAKPRVFIPVFPGTNCEADSAAEFTRAGAKAVLVNLVNMTPQSFEESVRRMADEIRTSQIVMIPGGFSSGDEPEGSAKFITAVFRNPYVRDAVADLMERRDGLMLGVCNGFQALIKLGLVPYGKIREPSVDAPTLTYNTIGRHVSKLVRTRVSSTLSPWLSGAEVGDVYTMPVSHSEGRFVASDKTLASLIRKGQIATQYANEEGAPSMNIDVNPNGSKFAVEGITSTDGRVFGKMGHVERVGKGLYKNVPGDYDNGIFRNGVNYFK